MDLHFGPRRMDVLFQVGDGLPYIGKQALVALPVTASPTDNRCLTLATSRKHFSDIELLNGHVTHSQRQMGNQRELVVRVLRGIAPYVLGGL